MNGCKLGLPDRVSLGYCEWSLDRQCGWIFDHKQLWRGTRFIRPSTPGKFQMDPSLMILTEFWSEMEMMGRSGDQMEVWFGGQDGASGSER